VKQQECLPLPCMIPTIPASAGQYMSAPESNMSERCKTSVKSGHSCILSCLPGYGLPTSIPPSICQQSVWHPALPTQCYKLCRPEPEWLIHGVWMCGGQKCPSDQFSQYVLPGGSTSLQCAEGFTPASESMRVCGQDGNWAVKGPQECLPMCITPEVTSGVMDSCSPFLTRLPMLRRCSVCSRCFRTVLSHCVPTRLLIAIGNIYYFSLHSRRLDSSIPHQVHAAVSPRSFLPRSWQLVLQWCRVSA